ncbi:hypothetical protein [Sphingobacterium pedocola]|uniref:Lipoprotein n=1 Tax=Sphingobacterium pedocola TaxID=2082722 RepID=A0ABR9T2K4_9SPHI|nr:hypothetical protein [Sphingobacterium pedocola]MBE8719567.1 hypothetical protein [Sphingobacterium pedocola]
MKKKLIILIAPLLIAGCSAPKQHIALLRDCPEEKIVNRMPTIRDSDTEDKPTSYFIYKGERRELSEFDLEWVAKNCSVEETIVH